MLPQPMEKQWLQLFHSDEEEGSMAPEGAGPPRSWSVSPTRPGTAIPPAIRPRWHDGLDPSVWTVVHLAVSKSKLPGSPLYGSHCIYGSYPGLPGIQKLNFPYTSKPLSLSKDTAKCQSPSSSASIAFGPTLKPQSGLPWWRSGWESACRCREHGFEPWSGKIPHATEQLGPWATTTEPARLEPVLRNERPRQWGAHAPRWRVAPVRHNWRKPSHRNEDPTQP